MNKLPIIALTASLSLGLSGCGDDEETVTPFNWTISDSNAKNVVGKVFSYEDSEGNATGTLTSDSSSDLKASNNQRLFNATLPCDKSGSVTSVYNGELFADFTWSLTFNSCNDGLGEGPVSGNLTIANSIDTPTTGDTTGMIDLNLTAEGFTITGDIDSTTYAADGSTETSFALGINATVGGSLTASTGTNFLTYFGDLYPSVGDMTITGPLNNSIIVTAIDSNDVQIEVDLGTDGIIESSEIVPWSSL